MHFVEFSTRSNNTSNIKTVIKDPRKILSKRRHKIPFQLLFQERVPFVLFSISSEFTRYRWKRGKIRKKGIGQPLFVYQLDEYSSLLNTDHPDLFNPINFAVVHALESKYFLLLLPAIDNNYYCPEWTSSLREPFARRFSIMIVERLKSLCNGCKTRPIQGLTKVEMADLWKHVIQWHNRVTPIFCEVEKTGSWLFACFLW